jgi:hypothetical protein
MAYAGVDLIELKIIKNNQGREVFEYGNGA